MLTNLAALKNPLPVWHPKAWLFAASRLALRTVGRLSKGIRIGLEHGFDSGVMLDHVYTNKAEGFGPIGRAIDRSYLDAPGWIGIRNRGRLLTRKLSETLRQTASEDGQELVLADLACGGGQYVLDALKQTREVSVQASLRDYRSENVLRARANAHARGLDVRVERRDAFSNADLAELAPCDVVIVSGLHEIIDDDALIQGHFSQVARLVKPGGTFIVTIQPDHPQLEFIARVLTTHTGRPWAMRLRSQELIEAWARGAGFRLIDAEMEEQGIFGVLRFEKV